MGTGRPTDPIRVDGPQIDLAMQFYKMVSGGGGGLDTAEVQVITNTTLDADTGGIMEPGADFTIEPEYNKTTAAMPVVPCVIRAAPNWTSCAYPDGVPVVATIINDNLTEVNLESLGTEATFMLSNVLHIRWTYCPRPQYGALGNTALNPPPPVGITGDGGLGLSLNPPPPERITGDGGLGLSLNPPPPEGITGDGGLGLSLNPPPPEGITGDGGLGLSLNPPPPEGITGDGGLGLSLNPPPPEGITGDGGLGPSGTQLSPPPPPLTTAGTVGGRSFPRLPPQVQALYFSGSLCEVDEELVLSVPVSNSSTYPFVAFVAEFPEADGASLLVRLRVGGFAYV